MKTFLLICMLSFGIFAAEKPAEVPESLKLSYFKLRAKQLRLTDQFKQLQIAQTEIVNEFNRTGPDAEKIKKELVAFCESKKQEFVETPDEISCVSKKEDKK